MPPVRRIIESLLKGAPGAQAEAKALIRDVATGARRRPRRCLGRHAAARLARLRVQAEAQEGFGAFFAKRKPRGGGTEPPPKVGWASLPVPCPNPLAILEDGVRGLSTWLSPLVMRQRLRKSPHGCPPVGCRSGHSCLWSTIGRRFQALLPPHSWFRCHSMSETQRDVMEYEVAIVGAGPAGLACAIRLKQLKPDLERLRAGKSRESGRAFPVRRGAWSPGRSMNCCRSGANIAPAICVPAARDEFFVHDPQQALSAAGHTAADGESRQLHHLARATGADPRGGSREARASMCLPDLPPPRPCSMTPAPSKGVRIGDMGVEKNGEPGPNFALGPEIHAKITMFCEGCRGSISKQLIKRFKLDAGKSPQTYGLGFKELWQLPPGRVQPGLIQHTVGLAARQPHLRRQFSVSPRQRSGVRRLRGRVWITRIRGFKPFEAFQQFKNHPRHQAPAAGRRDHRRRRAHRDRRRLSIDADAGNARRHAGGRCRRHAQHAEDQGIHQAIRSGMTAAAHYVETGTSAGFDAALARIDRAAANSTRCATSGPDSTAACGSASPMRP